MKTRKKTARKAAAPSPAAIRGKRWWYFGGLVLALYLGFQVYGPVLNGPFVFDDPYLPFADPRNPFELHLGLIRPVLMFSYWINYQLSGVRTFSYHAFNVLFHVANSLLVFLIIRKLSAASRAPNPEPRFPIAAAFAAGLFLLHPVQTESVAYVASRSESLSLLFFLSALALFLHRRSVAISWRAAAGVLLLFALAAGSKEHTVALVPLLLLTDYYWNPGFSLVGIRRNWRLYLPISLAGALGLVFVWKVLQSGSSAGFAIKDFTWYQYFFTQCRAVFLYLRLFVAPVGLTVDYDFPISRTIVEHGAVFGLIGILALVAAAIYFRRRYPLASYGLLAFVILLAPTSSFVPIKDPVAERRLYLAMIGLLCIVAEGLQRIKVRPRTLAGGLAVVLLVSAAMTYQRNQVWSDDLALWEDTVRKSPRKARAHFQLAYAYYAKGRCAEAVKHYQAVAALQEPNNDLLIDWGLACDCANDPAQALERFRQAAALDRSAHVFSEIGRVYAKNSQWSEALDALATAEKVDPGFAMTYVYRGWVHASTNQPELAVQDYRRALALDPSNPRARQGLADVTERLRLAR